MSRIRYHRQEFALAWGVMAMLMLGGCAHDEVSLLYPNGVGVYNFLNKNTPVQTISFERGMPPTLRGVFIDGIPVASYKRTVRGGIPVRRDEEGSILSLSYHGLDRHDIKFNVDDEFYTMPLTDKQLRHLFGRPKHVDRSVKRP